jgi:hypothetical protein
MVKEIDVVGGRLGFGPKGKKREEFLLAIELDCIKVYNGIIVC